MTLFEVAIILGLGSAAGDPMFQEDLPLLYAVIVLATVVLFYKSVTWAASRFSFMDQLLEGKVKTIVRNGAFDIENERDNDFSRMEFFAELRNQSVEHLGQVRLGLLEVDGTLSLLFYKDEDVKYGLPLFPDHYKAVDQREQEGGPYACMHCGRVIEHLPHMTARCTQCKHTQWAKAINVVRVK